MESRGLGSKSQLCYLLSTRVTLDTCLGFNFFTCIMRLKQVTGKVPPPGSYSHNPYMAKVQQSSPKKGQQVLWTTERRKKVYSKKINKNKSREEGNKKGKGSEPEQGAPSGDLQLPTAISHLLGCWVDLFFLPLS